MIGKAAWVALALSLGSAAAAQDINSTNSIAGDFAMIGIQHEVLNRSLGISDGPVRKGAPAPRTTARPGYFAPVRSGAATGSFQYQPSAALSQQVAKALLARTARQDPAAAKAIADEMARKDFGKVYADFVRPFGIKPDDAVDALTAYTLLGWMIATGGTDPTPRQVAAVRAQIAQRAAHNPSFTDPGARARLGEELKLLFVVLKAGWQSAGPEGNLRPYSDGVATLFLRNSIDLRALRLSDQGFTAA